MKQILSLALALSFAGFADAAPRHTKPTPKPTPKLAAQTLKQQALIAGRANNSPEARRKLAIQYVTRASVAYDRGDYRHAIALCDIAADWYPTYPRAHVWRGAAYQKLGNYTEARLAYKWARALAPQGPDAARANRGLREIGFQ